MPPPLDVFPLAAFPGCRNRRRGGKVASGGLRTTQRAWGAGKECGTRDSAPCGWEPRWGVALAQTNQSTGNGLLTDMLGGGGTPYGHGKQAPGSQFDCSGFVKWAFNQEGFTFDGTGARSGATNIINSTGVEQTTNPQPGDLVYWGNPPHIMIYQGDGMAYGARNYGWGVGSYPVRYFGTPTYYNVPGVTP